MGNDSEARDAVRAAADVTTEHLGRIASIIAAAVKDVAVELSEWVDDLAAKRPPEKPGDV